MSMFIHVPLYGLICMACGQPAQELVVGPETREVFHANHKNPCHPGVRGDAHLGVPLSSDWDKWMTGRMKVLEMVA